MKGSRRARSREAGATEGRQGEVAFGVAGDFIWGWGVEKSFKG